MNKHEKIPTFQEFWDVVKGRLKADLDLNDAELESFMKKEKATIEESYNTNKKAVEDGHTTADVFWSGGADGICMTLSLLY